MSYVPDATLEVTQRKNSFRFPSLSCFFPPLPHHIPPLPSPASASASGGRVGCVRRCGQRPRRRSKTRRDAGWRKEEGGGNAAARRGQDVSMALGRGTQAGCQPPARRSGHLPQALRNGWPGSPYPPRHTLRFFQTSLKMQPFRRTYGPDARFGTAVRGKRATCAAWEAGCCLFQQVGPSEGGPQEGVGDERSEPKGAPHAVRVRPGSAPHRAGAGGPFAQPCTAPPSRGIDGFHTPAISVWGPSG